MIRQTLQFRQIVREYSDRVYRTAHRMLGDDRDAEEAVQDVFVKVYNGLKDFRGESDVSTWIYRITVNACVSRRRRARRPEVSLDDPALAEEIATASSKPEELYEADDSRKHAVTLTARLSDKEAQVVTLFYLEELDYNTIARIMDIPPGSVATLLHRARMHLHYLMIKESMESSR